ncbi:helix-turn-helix domain-containing protein [Micromonospora carbonacea]|uniref:helix-turn-helix domain-containing protein n=1 Tax=Micromonospora carbonacea TaxID=47853 RepID=UPI00210C463D|nr:helix-turn-helix transcriptional regulator [Micromonospora carbonacea]
MPPVADGRFGAELRRLRMSARLSLRQLAPLALSSCGHLHALEMSRRQPTAELAARLDDVLESDGFLSGMLHPAPVPRGPERLTYVAQHPRCAAQPWTSLPEMLAADRRLEDTLGSTPLLPAIRTQLDLAATLVAETSGALRPQVVDLAAQWASSAVGCTPRATDVASRPGGIGAALE